MKHAVRVTVMTWMMAVAVGLSAAPDNPRYPHLQGIAYTYGAIRKHGQGKGDEARQLDPHFWGAAAPPPRELLTAP
jgi:hypothetical protein